MLRLIRCAPLLVLSLPGCFSEPPDAETGFSTSTTTDQAAPTSTGRQTGATTVDDGTSIGGDTTLALDSSGTGSSSGFGTTFGSTGADTSSSTGEPPPFCSCPPGELLFCETFEDFSEGMFADWVIPSPGEAPQQIDGLCDGAFRGQIGPDQEFAVLSRRELDVLDQQGADGLRLRGLIRIEEGCATGTRHRLVSARTDTGPEGYLYSAELEIDNGALTLLQRSTVPSETSIHAMGDAPVGDWAPFEISLLALQSENPARVRARVGMEVVEEDRIEFPTKSLSFSAVPGPFAYLDPVQAGCVVDFDNISVEVLFDEP